MLYKTIYHGSNVIIENPDLNMCKITNDYGKAFYCTEDLELAKEWASKKEEGVVNKYGLFTNELSILNLNEYSVLYWVTILIKNRRVDFSSSMAKAGFDYLIENFSIDTSKYDVIVGYRADDSYFSFVRGFLNNSLSINDLKTAMKLGKLGNQIAIMNERALEHLKFLGSEAVDVSYYKTQREKRDWLAKKEYEKISSSQMNGNDLYLIDLIRGKVDKNDPRI